MTPSAGEGSVQQPVSHCTSRRVEVPSAAVTTSDVSGKGQSIKNWIQVGLSDAGITKDHPELRGSTWIQTAAIGYERTDRETRLDSIGQLRQIHVERDGGHGDFSVFTAFGRASLQMATSHTTLSPHYS